MNSLIRRHVMKGSMLAIAVMAVSFVMIPHPAMAAAYSWNSTSGGNWNNTASSGWNAAAYPHLADDSAAISQNITANQILTNNVADAVMGSLTLGDSSGTSAWLITNTVSESLTFDVTIGSASLVSKGGVNTIGMPMVLNDSLSLSNASNLIVNGPITGGAVGVTKKGAGTLTFQGSGNTFSGTFTMDEGNVVLGKAASVISLAGNVVINAGTLNYNVTGAGSHQIADTANVTVSGGTFSGGASAGGANSEVISNLTVSAGSVSFGSGSANPTLTMNGTTTITGGSVTAGSRGSVVSLGACSISGGGTVAVTANSGSGNSALRTDGLLTITQPNAGAYTPISLSNNQNTKTAQLTLNGDLTFVGDGGNSNPSTIAASISGSGLESLNRIQISQATTTFNIGDGGADVDLIIQPNIVGSAAGKVLLKTGTGVLELDGTNTYSGGTTVTAGSLALGHDSVLGTGTLTFNGGGVQAANTAARIVTNAVAFSGDLAVKGSGDVTFSIPTIDLGAVSRTWTINNTATTTFSGALTNSAGLTKQGNGRLELSGNNTYGGATTNAAGTLVLSGTNTCGGRLVVTGGYVVLSNALAACSNTIEVGTAEGVRSDGYTGFTVTALAGSSDLTLTNMAGNAVTLSLLGNGSTYSGVLKGAGGLVKAGSGTQTLSGGNTYTGGTTVANGVLSLTTSALPTNGDVAITSPGVLDLAFMGTNTVRRLTVNNTPKNIGVYDATSLPGIITGTGALLVTDYPSGNAYWSGATDGAWSTAANWSMDRDVNTPSGAAPGAGSDVFFSMNGAVANPISSLNGDQAAKSLTFYTNVTIEADGSSLTLADGALVVEAGATGTLNCVMAGTAGLVKTGNGVLVLGGVNTFSGNTTNSAGTLTIATNGALSSGILVFNGGGIGADGTSTRTIGNQLLLAADPVVAGEGTLAFTAASVALGASPRTFTVNDSATAVFSGTLADAASLSKTGSGTLELDAANTYSGGTTLSSGILAVGNDNALGSGALALNGGTVRAVGMDPRSLTNALSFPGDPHVGGSGNVTFAATTINLGATTRTWTIDNTAMTTVSGVLTNSAGINKAGSGSLVLTGMNTFNGVVSISNGTVRLGNPLALQSNTVTMAVNNGLTFDDGISACSVGALAGNGRLVLTNALGGAVVVTNGGNNANTALGGVIEGSGGWVKTGSGTLDLGGRAGDTNANTYTGVTTINAGTVYLVKDGNTADPAVNAIVGNVVLNGGALNWGAFVSGCINGSGYRANQVADTANISVNGGTLDINQEAINSLIMNSGVVKASSFSVSTMVTTNSTGTGFTTINGGTWTVANYNSRWIADAVTISGGTNTVRGGSGAGYSAFLQVKSGGLTINQPDSNVFTALTLDSSGNPTANGYLQLDGTLTFVGNGLNTNPVRIASTETNSGLASANAIKWTGERVFDIGDGGASADLILEPKLVASSGAASLAKTGSGTLVLAAGATNTYTGSTTINAGCLLVNGVLTASAVTNHAAGILGGTGLINRNVLVAGGTLTPGNAGGVASAGQFFFGGDVTLTNAGSTNAVFQVDLGGITPGVGYDQLVLTNASAHVNLAGVTLDVALLGGFMPVHGSTYVIIDNTGVNPVSGTFFGYPEGSRLTMPETPSVHYVVSYVGGSGNDVSLTTMTDPGTVFLFR